MIIKEYFQAKKGSTCLYRFCIFSIQQSLVALICLNASQRDDILTKDSR